MPWVLIEQDEGLMVDYATSGSDVEVFFIDYDESKQNKEYADDKLFELHSSDLPQNIKTAVTTELLKQWPDLTE
jgi:hypothetical protein